MSNKQKSRQILKHHHQTIQHKETENEIYSEKREKSRNFSSEKKDKFAFLEQDELFNKKKCSII